MLWMVNSSSAGSENLKSQCLNACDKMLKNNNNNKRWMFIFNQLKASTWVQVHMCYIWCVSLHLKPVCSSWTVNHIGCHVTRSGMFNPDTENIIIIISIIIFIPVCYSIMWSSQKTFWPQLCIYRLRRTFRFKGQSRPEYLNIRFEQNNPEY